MGTKKFANHCFQFLYTPVHFYCSFLQTSPLQITFTHVFLFLDQVQPLAPAPISSTPIPVLEDSQVWGVANVWLSHRKTSIWWRHCHPSPDSQNKACVEGNVCLKTLVWLLTVGSSIADYIRFKRRLTSLEVYSGLVSCTCQEICPPLEFTTSSACAVFHGHDKWTVFNL